MKPSKADIKILKSLGRAHARKKHQKFVVEGATMMRDVLASDMAISWIAALPQWVEAHAAQLRGQRVYSLSPAELKQLSLMQQPNQVLAVVEMPTPRPYEWAPSQWVLVLDTIQDPGNLGTIIRTAEWFGVDAILCSPQTADLYNPKVVQASMGSVFRMPIYYKELLPLLSHAQKAGATLYATLLHGKNIYHSQLQKQGFLIIGNEGQGISQPILALQPTALHIPAAPAAPTESLNAAVATAICLSEMAAERG